MTVILNATMALLSLAGLLTLVRLVRGPSFFDRVVALDVLSVIFVSGIAVQAAAQGGDANIPLLVTVALLGFVGSVTAARFAGRGEPS